LNNRTQRPQTTSLDHARDELFSHVHRCGVLTADREQQVEWMTDTIEYIGERYPDLKEADLTQLREIGLRFCQPVIPHGQSGDAAAEAHDMEDAEENASEVAAA
jgi:hypothetical protein